MLFRPDTVCLLLDFCSPPPPILQLTPDSLLSMGMGYKAMSVMRKMELMGLDGGWGPGLGAMQKGVTI